MEINNVKILNREDKLKVISTICYASNMPIGKFEENDKIKLAKYIIKGKRVRISNIYDVWVTDFAGLFEALGVRGRRFKIGNLLNKVMRNSIYIEDRRFKKAP